MFNNITAYLAGQEIIYYKENTSCLLNITNWLEDNSLNENVIPSVE